MLAYLQLLHLICQRRSLDLFLLCTVYQLFLLSRVKQYKVEKDQEIFVDRLDAKAGDKQAFDNVLLVNNDGKIAVGKPTVDGAKVEASIVDQVKGDKVLVFKKKKRKGYQKMNGHRQQYTKIKIENIVA
jgi:large subunit ribosomal protein L21